MLASIAHTMPLLVALFAEMEGVEAAVAVKLAGAVGAVVSEDDVVAVEVEEKLLRFPAASVARTR